MIDSASQRSDLKIMAGGKINSELYMYYSLRNPEEFSITCFWRGDLHPLSLRQIGVRRYAPSSVATPRVCASTQKIDFNRGVSLTRVVMIIT